MDEKTHPGAHRAQVKELWQNVHKQKGKKQSYIRACKSNYHKWTSKDEVENHKEDIIVEIKDLIVKKEMENKKILREKNMTKSVNSMNMNN